MQEPIKALLVSDIRMYTRQRWDDLTFPAFLHSLATEVGKGLLIPNGIFSAV